MVNTFITAIKFDHMTHQLLQMKVAGLIEILGSNLSLPTQLKTQKMEYLKNTAVV